jgi:WD40-like Beta Propeller Repeat
MSLRTLPNLSLFMFTTLALVACSGDPEGGDPVAEEAPAITSEADAVSAEETDDASMSESEDAWFPDNEILLADLDLSGGIPRLTSDAMNITNRVGYDNQPFFLPDGSGVYYSSIGDDDQSDPYLYDIASGSTTRILNTPESEYSPTPMADGRFSAVRLDLQDSQQFWAWDPATGEGEELLPGVTRIGYFTWLDDRRIAMFVVEEPFAIYLADIETGATEKIIEQIGRGLARKPNSDLFGFIDASELEWDADGRVVGGKTFVATFDPETRQVERLVETPSYGMQDFAWTPDGGLLMGGGYTEDGRGRLLFWHAEHAPEWTEAALLPAMDGVPRPMITRMAVSPSGDRIAVVVLTNALEYE